MWNNVMYETEKRRAKEKSDLAHKNLIHGMILAPLLFLGWFPIVWVLSKLFR
jgi:hypothetical protein